MPQAAHAGPPGLRVRVGGALPRLVVVPGLAFPLSRGYAPAMPRILSLRPVDGRDWLAGLITVRPWRSMIAPEATIIEDIGRAFTVVWSGAPGTGA